MVTRRQQFQRRAYGIMNTALYNGGLWYPFNFNCADCGKPANAYDHRDYTKPLAVDPVCGGCNNRRGKAKQIPKKAILPDPMNWRDSPEEIVRLAKKYGLYITKAQVKKTNGQQRYSFVRQTYPIQRKEKKT